MPDMTPYDYIPVKHWWDEPASSPPALLVRAHGHLYLAAESLGAAMSTFLYWRRAAIPRKYWVSFERQGIKRTALEAHERQYKSTPPMTAKEYQRYYYLTHTLPKRQRTRPQARSHE